MTALTRRLPRKSSRTSTHAVAVPTTALIERDGEREHERQLERRDGLAVRDRVPEVPRLGDERRERQQHDEAQVADDEAAAEQPP